MLLDNNAEPLSEPLSEPVRVKPFKADGRSIVANPRVDPRVYAVERFVRLMSPTWALEGALRGMFGSAHLPTLGTGIAIRELRHEAHDLVRASVADCRMARRWIAPFRVRSA